MKLDSFITAPWNGDQKIVNEKAVEVTEKYVGADGIMTLKGMLDVMQECAHRHLAAVDLFLQIRNLTAHLLGRRAGFLQLGHQFLHAGDVLIQ